MARIDVDQADVMLAVLDHLRTELAPYGLNERTCFLVLNAAAPPPHIVASADNWFVLVSAGPGSFDPGLFFGGGTEQCMEAFQVVIGIYTRILLDEAGHELQALTAANRGILRLKKFILQAMANKDLTIDGVNTFQRETWRPVSASQPLHVGLPGPEGVDGGTDMVFMTLAFQSAFDWDLEYEDEESTS